jgi:murein DD-endopeptidase MepM/ murein hydrolase activator NlpD
MLLVAFALMHSPAQTPEDIDSGGMFTGDRSELKGIHVEPKREGDTIRFSVENRELCEVTMTFEVQSENLKSSQKLPLTATFPPGETNLAFELTPIDVAAKWSYSFTNYYKLGSNVAMHDDSTVYQLPYLPGDRFIVTQGFNGTYSHKGSNKYAIDWKMPEGTLVCAARSGMVVKTKDDSNQGGPSVKFDRYNNYVLIRHDDGTLAHYCHLRKDSITVKPGQRVMTGEVIARSGNTGFSSGAHLHFCVFKTQDGRMRESIPVRFRTSTETAVFLRESERYRAANIQTVARINVKSTPQLETHAQGGVGN